MVINSADEYEKLLNAYTLQEDSEIILQGFPRTLSFSRSFPESCVIVKTFRDLHRIMVKWMTF